MRPFSAVCTIIVWLASVACKPASTSVEETTPTASAPARVSSALDTPSQTSCTITTPLEPGIPGSPGHPIPSKINPNGDSELAVLMRTMRDDMRDTRDRLLRGAATKPLQGAHGRMRCVWPTDPKVRNESFDQMVSTYLIALEDMENETSLEDKKMAYGRALNACVTCHQNTCPGPIASIKALELPE